MHNPRRARALAVCTGVSVAHRSRARIVPRAATGPRTCVSGSQKPPSRCATGREKRCAGSLSFRACAARLARSRARSKLFCKRVSSKNFYARFARPPARTCVFLLHRRGVQPPPLWRELPGVPPPRTCVGGSMSTRGSELPGARIESPGTGPRTCAGLSMSTSGSELPGGAI